MTPRPPDQAVILDYLYDLLDPAEAVAVDALCASDAAWATARDEAARVQGLLGRAAKVEFPQITFAIPIETSTPSKIHREKEERARDEVTVTSAWLRWVVAASLLLTTAAVGGPASRDLLGHLWFQPDVNREFASVEKAKLERERVGREMVSARKRAEERYAAAEKSHDDTIAKWLKAEQQAVVVAANRLFTVEVRGPAAAAPGAPNDYTITIRDKNNATRSVELNVAVKDATGKAIFEKKYTATGEQKVHLPATLWNDLPPGTDLFLSVTAVDPKSGDKSIIQETVRLQDPVFTTFLTTDKPMYRPGETIFFRSLTLDRARFLPPDRELNLLFALNGPSGQPVPNQAVAGLAKPGTVNRAGSFAPILGPDGKPVRGVGTGAFNLPQNLAGGEYTLNVYELPATENDTPSSKDPIAVRKILINNYTPDKLLKKLEFDASSYGPGDAVQVKLEVFDQSKPVAGARVSFALDVDKKLIAITNAPVQTDAKGIALVRFTLPAVAEIKHASLRMTVQSTVSETMIKSIPLASRKIDIEFFPEGGDLVVGVPARVYFRATTSYGKPADVTGVLTDGTRTLGEVKTLTDADNPGANQGLGAFEFTPEAGKQYSVKLSKPFGTIQPLTGSFSLAPAAVCGIAVTAQVGYALPPAKPTGVVLTVPTGVTQAGEKISLRLQSPGEKRNVLIGAYIRGRAVAVARTTLEPGKLSEVFLDLADTKIGGVTRITVFEETTGEGREDLKPVAERLVYRQPAEELKLNVTAHKSNGLPMLPGQVRKPTGEAFLPGDDIELDITATDETGKPKPAVLWTAVVNQSMLTMADEKTARLLPTHFLLAGEVRKPDDLEHADFLLTAHPKAKTSLDLLLGTQGWRRFAEQSPEQFRNRVPAQEADRLLVSLGSNSMLLGSRADVRKVFDDYYPQYEAAILELDTAEKHRRTGPELEGLQREANRYESEYAVRMNAFGQAINELDTFEESMAVRKTFLPFTIFFTFGLGLVLAIVRFTRPKGAPERRTLTKGAIGFFGVGLFVAFSLTVVALSDTRWKSMASIAPKPNRDDWFGGRRPAPPMVMQKQWDVIPPGPGRIVPPIGKQIMNPKGPVVAGNAGPQLNRPLPIGVPPRGKQPVVEAGQAQGLPGANARLIDQLLRTHSASNAERNAKEALAKSIPQAPPLVVREYAHVHKSVSANTPRTDFTETLLWQPVLVLPGDGKTTVTFSLSDAIAPYQVLVAGHTLDGRLGAVTGMIEVRKPFAVDPKLPQEISSSDKLDVPILLTNGTPEVRTANVKMELTGLTTEPEFKFEKMTLAANSNGRKTVRLVPNKSEGNLAVTLTANAGPGHTDAIERTFTVVPDGFPAHGAKSDLLEQSDSLPITLPANWIPGTLRATVTVYPNTLAEIQGGLTGLLREPSGCFEQSSTSNYPNVLVLNYLQEANRNDPATAQRARELMDRGYSKLVGYECPKTGATQKIGFEWFGATDRPHEALTAYGLMQFTDMARVYPVDADLLKRTKQFLLDSRDGAGGFKRNNQKIDTFGGAPVHVTNAYIVWAVTESEKNAPDKSDLARELDALLALTSSPAGQDPYFLSLVANALLNRGKLAEGLNLLKILAEKQAKDGSVLGAATSITSSTGRDLAIETTALAVLGWLKANRADLFTLNVASAMKWIGAQRNGGGSFGSTQSTILALKALVEQARTGKRPTESGELFVTLAGREVARRAFSNEAAGPITIDLPESALQPGNMTVMVETTAKQAYPVAIAWDCRTRQPNSSPDCTVKLSAKLARTELNEGEAVHLDVTVENLKATPQGMVVAIVGIPAGLKLPEDLKQLKALTAVPVDGSEPTVSYWETRGREVIFYWRGLTPKQSIRFPLDLIAEIPGEYRGPASRAYLYYNADAKHWIEPVDVKIRPQVVEDLTVEN